GGDRTGTGVGRAGGEEEGDNEEVTRFSFLGFKGQWMPLNREPVNVLYEAAANPGDHPSIVGTRDPLSGNMNGARDAGG
ncbi:MAG: ubiquitin-binding protein cue5, partial [Watsoniomyces obsoletus]